MADRLTSGNASPPISEADLGAFFRGRADVPAARGAALIGSLSRLRGSDDPVVTFGRLPAACVPEFADGCEVELSNGAEPLFRVRYPASLDSGPEPVTTHRVGPDQVLSTPFRANSRIGYPSYAGVVTHWWTSRTPSESDAVIADLMVKHLASLVDHERLMAVVAQAEDRTAGLALQAISGRTINLAIGIVMHENGFAAEEAEDLLRQSAVITGTCLHQVAMGVVRSRSLVSERGRCALGDLTPRRDR
jgi:ANTAR domain